jgi:hypothetical protein
VTEPRRRSRCTARGALLQVVEVADGANVREAVVLEQREPRRVVPAVLEALETVHEERLAPPRSDVSDDPAHALNLLFSSTGGKGIVLSSAACSRFLG